MATQMMTYAPPSPGLSITCERRSDRSVPSYSVAALWWGAEAIRVAGEGKTEESGRNVLRRAALPPKADAGPQATPHSLFNWLPSSHHHFTGRHLVIMSQGFQTVHLA